MAAPGGDIRSGAANGIVDAQFGRHQLTSTLVPGTATGDFDLLVYGASGGLLAKSENGAGVTDAVSVTNYNATTMTRYVRVVYYSGGTGATNGKDTLKMGW